VARWITVDERDLPTGEGEPVRDRGTEHSGSDDDCALHALRVVVLREPRVAKIASLKRPAAGAAASAKTGTAAPPAYDAEM